MLDAMYDGGVAVVGIRVRGLALEGPVWARITAVAGNGDAGHSGA